MGLLRARPHGAAEEDGAFLAGYVEHHRKNVAAAKAETVSGPDATISGTYLTQIINNRAAEDARFAADDGTAAVWMLRHIDTGGKHRTFASLLHGTMASGMPSALGLQKCQPGRQVICLAGDGGFTMLLGELLTVVQENLPIKIVVYDNGGPPLRGHVESISRGITDRDNPAGLELRANITPTFEWVRLAQRIPVRIHIDKVPEGVLIASGMTATVVVEAAPWQWATLAALRRTSSH